MSADKKPKTVTIEMPVRHDTDTSSMKVGQEVIFSGSNTPIWLPIVKIVSIDSEKVVFIGEIKQ